MLPSHKPPNWGSGLSQTLLDSFVQSDVLSLKVHVESSDSSQSDQSPFFGVQITSSVSWVWVFSIIHQIKWIYKFGFIILQL